MSALKELLNDPERMEKHDVDAEQIEFMIVLDETVKEWVATDGKDTDLEDKILKALNAWHYQNMPYAIKNYPFVTSHKLKMLQRNPYIADQIFNKLVPSCKPADKDYFLVGLAVDVTCTYGEKEFQNKFAVKNRPDAAFKAEAKEKGQVILSESLGAQVDECVKEFKSRKFFPDNLIKTNFVTVSHGLPLKIELDDWRPNECRFGDLKTNRNVNSFISDAGWQNYLLQMGFYNYVILRKADQTMSDVAYEDFKRRLSGHLYVVDKYADFSRSHCFVFRQHILNEKFGDIDSLLEKWRKAIDSGIWEWTFDLENPNDLKMFNDCELYPLLWQFKDMIQPTYI